MKRDNQAITTTENDHKKKKLTTKSDSSTKQFSFTDLNGDEWSLILSYLSTGGVLMMAMTSKGIHEWITDYIKKIMCKYYVVNIVEKYYTPTHKDWSIVNALRQKERLLVTISNVNEVQETLKRIAFRNGLMEELTNLLNIDSISDKSAYELLDVRKESLIPIQIETLCFELSNDHVSEKRRKIIKTIEKEPIGYGLKGVEIRMTLTKTKFYKILTKMKDLESLILNIGNEEGWMGAGRGKGPTRKPIIDNIIDETNEAFDENNIFIPIFNNLKYLKVEKYFNHTTHISEILELFPNLEHLSLAYSYTVIGDAILKSICESCPKLKSLHIYYTDRSFAPESKITDKGVLDFLGKQSSIEILDFKNMTAITGSLLKKLGNFPTLKKFRMERFNQDAFYVDQEEDIYFGGNPNPRLEFVDIGIGYDFTEEQFDKLVTSLKTVAPNLKDFGHFGILSSKKSKKISELFVNTLEKLNVDSSTLDLIPFCTNLKRVYLESDLTREHKMLTNLNVTEMVDSCDKQEIYPMLTESFPNLKLIESNGIALFNFLLENNNSWPKLECIKLKFSPETVLLESLISQRPTLVIELVDNEKTLRSPQEFYYQWLVRDGERNIREYQ